MKKTLLGLACVAVGLSLYTWVRSVSKPPMEPDLVTQATANAIYRSEISGVNLWCLWPPDLGGEDMGYQTSDPKVIEALLQALRHATRLQGEGPSQLVLSIYLKPKDGEGRPSTEFRFISPRDPRLCYGPEFQEALYRLSRHKARELGNSIRANASKITSIDLSVTTTKHISIHKQPEFRQLLTALENVDEATFDPAMQTPSPMPPGIWVKLFSHDHQLMQFNYVVKPKQGPNKAGDALDSTFLWPYYKQVYPKTNPEPDWKLIERSRNM